jgi:uncharacterized protein
VFVVEDGSTEEVRSRPRRRWRVVALAVLVVLVLAWLGAAQYFAGEIRAGALEIVPPGELERNVLVVDATAAGVALGLEPEPPPAATLPGTWGLAWPEGYGHLGDIRERTESTIRRDLEVLRGDDPPPPGELVGVDRDSWGVDPGDVLGYRFSEVVVDGPIGDLPAWFVPAPEMSSPSGTWVLLVHGKGARRTQGLRPLRPVHEAGHPALLVSYRNDPGTEPDPDGVYGYGDTEWPDLEAAIAFALGNGAESVVLYGFSMGGAISVVTADRSELAGSVAGLALDAPLLDLGASIDTEASQRTIPGTPLPLPPGLAATAKLLLRATGDPDVNAVDHTGELVAAPVPVLVVHGTEDLTTPVEVTDEVVRAREEAGRETSYLRVDGAAHVAAWNADPQAYEDAVREFLAEVTAAP